MKYLNQMKNEALVAYGLSLEEAEEISLAPVPNNMEGDWGFQVFSLAKKFRKSPNAIAEEIAQNLRDWTPTDLIQAESMIDTVTTEKGFVNISFKTAEYASYVLQQQLVRFTKQHLEDKESLHIGIEFSSPNTNKPQHLGHARNNVLGENMARLLEKQGHEVTRINLINDRGIHICKSMLAYQKWGGGETPDSLGIKGDHFVGKFYVMFNEKLQEELALWYADAYLGIKKAEEIDPHWYFNHQSALGAEVKQMLVDWELQDPEVRALWTRMNAWVIGGFNETYERLDIKFDRIDLESDTYLLGKDLIMDGLAEGLFHLTENGAVAFDLTKIGMEGTKIVQRADGTSMYITQDLGTAIKRFEELDLDRLIYVVADEQKYHFEVLFGILGKLRPELQGRLQHLSYGMVNLPDGKMKSREGTVVDLDDLMDSLKATATKDCITRGTDPESQNVAENIAQGALRFYLSSFGTNKTITFDPGSAISFQGRTGPFIQYTYARIEQMLANVAEQTGMDMVSLSPEDYKHLQGKKAKDVLTAILSYGEALEQAEAYTDPSKIALWLYDLCAKFNSLYNDPEYKILDKEEDEMRALCYLSSMTQCAIQEGMVLLNCPIVLKM